jgi:multicomponent Na+:H+ antiporter subunit B
MVLTEFYLIILLVFMIIGALVAAETKSLISSVISLGAVGVGVSISFLFLNAPDLAIVQIAVEVVYLIFFIRATIGREVISVKGNIPWQNLIVALILIVILFVFGIVALQDLPNFGNPIIAQVKEAPSNLYIEKGLQETGAANIVTSVILDYRGYDTLGEATVLFSAILGALTILRGKSKKET